MKAVFESRERGFSLIEILIALLITMIVMASVFMLLQRGQDSFRREPEVADMTANARAGLSRISQDLAVAGFRTPATMAIMWNDGGGITPDELTIIYANPDIPVSQPMGCMTGPGGGGPGGGGGGGGPGGGGGACNTIGTSAVLNLDPNTFEPMPTDFENSTYEQGQVLFAIQGPNGDPACDTLAPAIIPFELTQPPTCTNAGGSGDPQSCGTVNINHNPGNQSADLNPPQGFDGDVSVGCAVVGVFHVIQYRINPLPPAENPALERRDVSLGEPWTPVAGNIENLQVQYASSAGVFEDVPSLLPMGNDPGTYITNVRVTVSGRSESTNLEGATQGVFAAEDTHLRRAFTTTVSLRNQLAQAQEKAFDLGLDGWN